MAFFYITSNGAANVRKSGDYLAKAIELAGGTYLFQDLPGKTMPRPLQTCRWRPSMPRQSKPMC